MGTGQGEAHRAQQSQRAGCRTAGRETALPAGLRVFAGLQDCGGAGLGTAGAWAELETRRGRADRSSEGRGQGVSRTPDHEGNRA